MHLISRPGPDEYAPHFQPYIACIADEDVVAVMAAQLDEVQGLTSRLGEVRGDYRYAAGKWSVKEIVGHLSDTERVFGCRALRFGRGDPTPLPSFDDQTYVNETGAAARTLADMAAEWADLRRATLSLFRGLPAAAWARRGIASGATTSVRALGYIIAGHTRHHLETLAARYAP